MSHCSHLRSEYACQGTTGRPENHPFASCRLARLARLCAHNLTCLKLLLLLLQCCCNAAGLLRSTVRGSGASSPPSSLAALASSAESGGTTSSTPKSIGMPGAWKRSASLSQLTRYVLVPNQMLVRPLSYFHSVCIVFSSRYSTGICLCNHLHLSVIAVYSFACCIGQICYFVHWATSKHMKPRGHTNNTLDVLHCPHEMSNVSASCCAEGW